MTWRPRRARSHPTRVRPAGAGIPAQFRNRVWPHISGANLLRSLSAPGYYDDLVAGATRAMKVDVVEGIDRELHRTFNGHVWFDRPAGIVPLRRILIAYSIRNPAVGFQSYMNHVGALLLLFLDEENAFWMLCIIVEYLTASNYDWQQQRITNPESTPGTGVRASPATVGRQRVC